MRSLVLLTTLVVAGCHAHADQTAKPANPTVAWHRLGSWSGHGSVQTESFTSETGTLRVRWETGPAAASAPAGAFRLAAHSAISGRLLQQVVDQSGDGSGTGYVQQDPHVFYMVVEAQQVSWKFTVEEAVALQ